MNDRSNRGRKSMKSKLLNFNFIKMNKKQKLSFGIFFTLLVIILASAFSHSIEDDWLRAYYFFKKGVWVVWVIVVAALGWLWHKILE